MITKKWSERSSGILTHVTSIPSPFGIGDLGPGTQDFLRFLSTANQSIWQILPLGPTDAAFGHSPYMSVSAFAGNSLLISPIELYKEGYLQKKDIDDTPTFSPYSVNFPHVEQIKTSFLRKAFSTFSSNPREDFEEFINESDWLDDYSLFMVLRNKLSKPWYEWPRDLVVRNSEAISTIKKEHKREILYHRFVQYLFAKQWRNIHKFASELSISIFGDIPIYVSLDSADVWANQDIFQLSKKTRKPTHVAGVPPDYFSTTGQKWGNPLYRWNSDESLIEDKLTTWWAARFSHIFKQVDLARIDHFRGFESYWSVPATHKTAMKGSWKKGPGYAFFEAIFDKLGELPIVAEDLGDITPEVIKLRDKLAFPGMRILQFAFDGNPENSYLPYNYETSNTYVYTGTHDNDTTLGWYLDEKMSDEMRIRIKYSANREVLDHQGIHCDLIYLAMSSIAKTAIFPLQDILGFGTDCRMNTPGTSDGNWVWRCSEEFLTSEVSQWMKAMTVRFHRSESAL